jgi:hypothetical protein
MNVNLKASHHFASLMLLSLALVGCAANPTAPPPELVQRIESARTRGDHEALAKHFEQQAAAARLLGAEHRKMAKSYQASAIDPRGSGRMPTHCDTIARSQESIAAEYDGMAEGHRQMAKQAQP